jgi:hypothetical protein
LGTWNVRSLYGVGSLSVIARELDRYKLDIAGVQEVRWEKEGTVRAGEYSFFYGKGKERKIINLGIGLFVHHRIVSAVKRVEFIGVRVSYIVLRGRRCNIVVLNVRHQVKVKVMIKRTTFTRNWNRFLIIFLSIT